MFDSTEALLVGCLVAHFFLLGAAALAAAGLLSAGKPLGRALAWCVVPFFFINNPIFLVVSLLVVQALVSRDMRLHLRLGARPLIGASLRP